MRERILVCSVGGCHDGNNLCIYFELECMLVERYFNSCDNIKAGQQTSYMLKQIYTLSLGRQHKMLYQPITHWHQRSSPAFQFVICQLILIDSAAPPTQASSKITVVLLNHNFCRRVSTVVIPVKGPPSAHIHLAESVVIVIVVRVDQSAEVKTSLVITELG